MPDLPPAPAAPERPEDDLVAGDVETFKALVLRHQASLYRFALRLTGTPHEAQEVLQDALLSGFRGLSSFEGRARFTTWIYQVVTNAALMHLRKSRRHEAESLEQYLPQFDDAGKLLPLDYDRAARADELLEQKQLAQLVQQAVSALPEHYRTAFVLRDLEELSSQEAAEVLGITVETLRQRLHRARLIIRGMLGKALGGEP